MALIISTVGGQIQSKHGQLGRDHDVERASWLNDFITEDGEQ